MFFFRPSISSSFCSLVMAGAFAILPIKAVADEQFKVVTTFTVLADMARNVAGDAAVVESVTKTRCRNTRLRPHAPRYSARTRCGFDFVERAKSRALV
jgi:hypothetical protein